ncbi:MAG: toprim domain-containing protein [Niastella sp.]|nr:toprim domain-containing protein [Niastella sp.]
MNIEQAKAISIIDLLTKLGHKPVRTQKHRVRYLSPYRVEQTASFDVHPGKNIWIDRGDGNKGGNTLDLALQLMKFLTPEQEHNIQDALRWLGNMAGLSPVIKSVEPDTYFEDDSALSLTKITAIENSRLIEYLSDRGIPLSVGLKYLKQALIYNKNSQKHFKTLALRNDEKGWELRNPVFKGCIRPKDVTFIRGKKPEQKKGIHLFEGFMDYLSVITINEGKGFRDDAIILNSLSCMEKATGYIKGYGYKVAYTWMDNDMPGKDATASLDAFFLTESDLRHEPMNYMYEPYKDVNAWHIKKLGLFD